MKDLCKILYLFFQVSNTHINSGNAQTIPQKSQSIFSAMAPIGLLFIFFELCSRQSFFFNAFFSEVKMSWRTYMYYRRIRGLHIFTYFLLRPSRKRNGFVKRLKALDLKSMDSTIQKISNGHCIGSVIAT